MYTYRTPQKIFHLGFDKDMNFYLTIYQVLVAAFLVQRNHFHPRDVRVGFVLDKGL